MGTERGPDASPSDRQESLYDVETWWPRTRVDRLAVGIYRGLRANVGRLAVAFAVVLLGVQVALGGFILLRQPTLDVLTVLSVVPAFLLAAAIWYLDPTDREPFGPMAATFLLGFLFAGFAAVVNTVFLSGFRLIPVVGLALLFYLVVGPLEESVKWLAVWAYPYRLPSFRSVADGMVYGAVAGLGFATVENSIYISHQFLSASQAAAGATPMDPIRAAVETATGRSLAGPGHVIYSAISGYYLGLAKSNRADFGPIVVKGLLLAAVVHATYDTVVTYANLAVLSFLVFVVVYDGTVLYLLSRKLARYRRLVRERTVAASPAET